MFNHCEKHFWDYLPETGKACGMITPIDKSLENNYYPHYREVLLEWQKQGFTHCHCSYNRYKCSICNCWSSPEWLLVEPCVYSIEDERKARKAIEEVVKLVC